MLTRLRVQGFKNLLDIDVQFGPFTCIAGLNGAGKSNLFDAIRFLNLLTQHPIMEAAQQLREAKGRSPEPRSLFTTFDGYTAPEMRFTAELIVERSVQDDFGVSSTAAISTLRYEVAFRLQEEDGTDRLVLMEEKLEPRRLRDVTKELGFKTTPAFRKSCLSGRRGGTNFISTQESEITVHQEGHGGRKLPAPKSSRTIVGGMASSDYPTILAVHREMQSWQTLLLEPSAMRAPSFYQDKKHIDSRGANLPAAIFRLQKDERSRASVCAELANRLSELIEDVQDLRVRDDPKTETLTLEVRGRDGVFHPARSLSDGTLRFLVLTVLAQDPQTKGIICLEEPENGIHPERIPAMVNLLSDIAVDSYYEISSDNPLRQVIINTHSPEIFQTVSPDNVIYVSEEQITLQQKKGTVAATLVPNASWRSAKQSANLPPGWVQPYLGKAIPTEQRQLWIDYVQGSKSS